MRIKESIVWKTISRQKRLFLSEIAPKYESSRIFEGIFGRPINWNNPGDINEKVHCLKLGVYYNNPVITKCVDKLRVKEYVSKYDIKCAEVYGEYDCPKDIKWDLLPDSFVIKCNHGCDFNIFVSDKKDLDIMEAKRKLSKWMKYDYWKECCETQYKYIEKKIFIEEFLGNNILTYKFYCFNGEPKVLYVSSNGEDGEKDKYIDFFDMKWNHLDIRLGEHLSAPVFIERPSNFSNLIAAAEYLCKDFPFVRVDLYDIKGVIYLSELTFIPTGGFMILRPEGTVFEWGRWLNIQIHNQHLR